VARLLGIDVGTSAMKAVLVDENGQVLRTASVEYRLHTPQSGWAEQDPGDWEAALWQVLDEIGETPDAIGLTGQMHGMVALDGSDQVVRNVILWCDQRTAEECREIESALGAERVREVTGNPMLTGFQAPKIVWMRKNEPESFSRTRSVLLPKDYIRFLLTGVKATDVSDASGVGLLDIRKRKWWNEGMEGLGLEPGWFPEVFESSVVTSSPEHGPPRERTDRGTPGGNCVVAGAGDQAAGAVGTGAVEPGVLSVSLGTSGVVFTTIKGPDAAIQNDAVHTFCHANGGWHRMGVMLSCGGAVKWARDALFGDSGYDRFDQEVESIHPGCEGVTFLPYLSGERCPHVDPEARGAFGGLSLAHGRAHIARAVLEGATFGIRDCYDALDAKATEVRVTGGGAKSDVWMQMLADVLGVSCVRLADDEGPALGAALLAGVGVGVWPDAASASRAAVKFERRFEPEADYAEPLARYRRMYPHTRAWTKG
jgi:xylulokinase